MRTSNVQATRILSFKLLNFWYTTLLTLHHIDNTCSSLCWKCLSTQGNYSNCWWDCPIVNSFWKKKIHVSIKKILGWDVLFSKELLLLDIWEDNTIPPSTRDQMAIITSVAKTVIAWRWRSSKVLSLEDWLTKMWEYYITKKLTYRFDLLKSRQSSSEFTTRWFMLLEFLKEKHTIPVKYGFLDLDLF